MTKDYFHKTTKNISRYITPGRIFFVSLIFAVLYIVMMHFVIPHVIPYFILRGNTDVYTPLACYDQDVLRGYGPRYRDVIDGRILVGEIDTYEHKDGPALFQQLPPIIMAPFFLPFNSIAPGMIITDFVFPLLTFLSLFLLFVTLTKSRFFALFFSLWLMVYAHLILYFPPWNLVELKVLILRLLPFLTEKVPYVSPTFRLREAFIPGAPFFILSFYFIYCAVKEKVQTNIHSLAEPAGFIARCVNMLCKWCAARVPSCVHSRIAWPVILAGVFYGVLFYLYLFYWIFMSVFLGLFFLALVIAGKKREALIIFIAGIIGLVVAIPFWINHFNLANLPHYQEIMNRVAGYEFGHAFRLHYGLWAEYLTYVALSVAALWLGKKLHTPVKALFLATLSIIGIAVLNIQVITGFNVQSDHWFTRVLIITTNIVWAVVAYDLFTYFRPSLQSAISRHKKTIQIVFFIVALYLSASVLYNQIIAAKRDAYKCTMSESLMKGYEWLNTNTPTDSVVMTPSFTTSAEIPFYTHNRIFFARGFHTIASDEEIFNRLYITYKLLGVSPGYLFDFLSTYDGIFNTVTTKYLSRGLYAYYGGSREHIGYNIPLSERERILNEYIFFKIPEKIPYRLDYIFIGPREREIGIDATLFIRSVADEVYNSDGVSIYKLDKKEENEQAAL